MKLLAVFLLVGLAVASALPFLEDDLERELDEIADELGDEFIMYSEGGLIERLKKRFEELVENIKKESDEGKGISERLMKKAQEFLDKLKKMGVEISEKIQKIFDDLKSKMDGNSPQHADWNDWKDRLRQLRDKIQNHEFDEAKIRDFIEKIFGKSEMSDQLIAMLKTRGEKGKQRIIDFINRILGEKQEAFASLRDKLQQQFEKMLENMEKAVDEGKTVSENMWKKAKDMYEKLGNLGVEFNDKIKEIYEKMKGKFEQNSVQHVEFAIFSRIKERLENLISRMHKDMEDGKGVRGDFMKKLTDVFEKFKGLGGELNQKFKDMLENLRSRFDKSSPAQHSVKEIYEKVKKFFRDLNIELKEKFVKFGEYVKEQYHKGLDKTKSDIDNVKNIAHKFIEDSRKISKDMAEEALEFFRQYKDDLGHIYGDVVDKVLDILKKED